MLSIIGSPGTTSEDWYRSAFQYIIRSRTFLGEFNLQHDMNC